MYIDVGYVTNDLVKTFPMARSGPHQVTEYSVVVAVPLLLQTGQTGVALVNN